MHQEQREARQPTEEGDRLHEARNTTDEDRAARDRRTAHQVHEGHAPQQRRHEAPEEEGQVPGPPPRRRAPLRSELERDATDDERDQDEEQREVELTEHRPVPSRECGKRRTAGDDQPDLVAIPERSDRVETEPPVDVVGGDDRREDGHAEVETLEHEVPGPQQADEGEPDGVQAHHGT